MGKVLIAAAAGGERVGWGLGTGVALTAVNGGGWFSISIYIYKRTVIHSNLLAEMYFFFFFRPMQVRQKAGRFH